jgi:hypothetical protein
MSRRNLWAKEGYVADSAGLRALSRIEVIAIGSQANGTPETLVHKVTDVFGEEYEIQCDLRTRLADVPLVSEAASGRGSYQVIENFCRCSLSDSDERGIALVELGRNSLIAEPFEK